MATCRSRRIVYLYNCEGTTFITIGTERALNFAYYALLSKSIAKENKTSKKPSSESSSADRAFRLFAKANWIKSTAD